MPVSASYCKSTPIKKMGFSQRSTCKARGLIPRSGKLNKGKYIKSPKYSHRLKSNSPTFYKRYKKLSKSRRSPRVPKKYKGENPRHHSDLYTDENPKKTVKGLMFKDKRSAEKSVKRLRSLYKSKKITFAHMRQIGITMEQRSRFHAHPTKGIKEGNKVWKKFNKSFK